MNTHTPQSEDGPLDRDERELADLYRQLPDAEPGPQLDARILAEAEHAVSAPRKRARAGSWLIGLSSAAALVLAGGLAWRLHQPQPPAHVHAPLQMRFMPSTASSSGNLLPSKPPAPAAQAPQVIKHGQPSPVRESAQAQPALSARILQKADMRKPRAQKVRRAKSDSNANKTMSALPAPSPPPSEDLPGIPESSFDGLPRDMQTLSVSTLVDRAHMALAHHHLNRARAIVHVIRARFPDYTLPDDLAAMGPAHASSTGTP